MREEQEEVERANKVSLNDCTDERCSESRVVPSDSPDVCQANLEEI